MFRAIIFGLLGAGAMYLYLNPGDVDGLQNTARTLAHDGALWIANQTQ
jgi:hypothetical protein